MTEAAVKLEDLSVVGYNAQAPALSAGALAAAARIVSVEARHAAWIRDRRHDPAPDASEPIVSAKRVMATLEGSRVRAMSDDLRLADLDVDGALEEAIDALHGDTRARSAARRGRRRARCSARPHARGGLRPCGRDEAHPQLRARARVPAGRVLQRGRAARRPARATSPSRPASSARTSARTSRRFAACSARAPLKRPRFDFRGATEDAERFRQTAVAFEDLAVAAYKAQAPPHPAPRLPRAGAGDPHGRGAPRRVDPAARGRSRPRLGVRRAALAQSTLAIVAATRFEVMKRDEQRSAPNTPAETRSSAAVRVLVAAAGAALALVGQRRRAARRAPVDARGRAGPGSRVHGRLARCRCTTARTSRAGHRCRRRVAARARPAAGAAVVAVLDRRDARGHDEHRRPLGRSLAADGRSGSSAPADPAQRQDRLGPALGARRLRTVRHASWSTSGA